MHCGLDSCDQRTAYMNEVQQLELAFNYKWPAGSESMLLSLSVEYILIRSKEGFVNNTVDWLW